MLSLFTSQYDLRRLRSSRLAARIWLFVLFLFLYGMNYVASFNIPLIGAYGPIYLGALLSATVWDGVLLCAIFFRQGWARFILAGFLLCFVTGHVVFVPEVVVQYPFFGEAGVDIVLLISLSNIFVAGFLMASTDIRGLCRPAADSGIPVPLPVEKIKPTGRVVITRIAKSS